MALLQDLQITIVEYLLYVQAHVYVFRQHAVIKAAQSASQMNTAKEHRYPQQILTHAAKVHASLKHNAAIAARDGLTLVTEMNATACRKVVTLLKTHSHSLMTACLVALQIPNHVRSMTEMYKHVPKII